MIYIKEITSSWQDYPSSDDIAVVVFFTGCSMECNGCHNTQLKQHQSPNISLDVLVDELQTQLHRNQTNKLVLSGGDPLDPTNIDFTKRLLSRTKPLGWDVTVFTGRSREYVIKNEVTDFMYIKCGMFDDNRFVGAEKTDSYYQLASENQMIVDVEYNELTNNGRMYF